MSVNVEEIKRYIGESRAIVDLVLEVCYGRNVPFIVVIIIPKASDYIVGYI